MKRSELLRTASDRDYDPIFDIPLRKEIPWRTERTVLEGSRGAFGLIYTMETKAFGAKFVIKELREVNPEKVQREAESFKMFNGNPNIVNIHHFVATKDKSNFYLILEYCEGGDLKQKIAEMKEKGKRFSEEQLLKICEDVLNGIADIHQRGYLYCDLKPENVGLKTEKNGVCTYKLLDFGLVKKLEELNKRRVKIGTGSYRAPEFLTESEITYKIDSFSFGCLLYELVQQKRLVEDICPGMSKFDEVIFFENLMKIKKEFMFEEYPMISKVINMCLKVEASQRWSVEDIQAFLGLTEKFPLRPHMSVSFSKKITLVNFDFLKRMDWVSESESARFKEAIQAMQEGRMIEGYIKSLSQLLKHPDIQSVYVEGKYQYLGIFKEETPDKIDGFGLMYNLKEKELYVGEMARGLPEGDGFLIFKDKNEHIFSQLVKKHVHFIIGHFRGGEIGDYAFHLEFDSGTYYQGQLTAKTIEGTGKLTISTEKGSHTYSGIFKQGLLNCLRGSLCIAEHGLITKEYTGEFVSNSMTRGKLHITNGEKCGLVYEGIWSDMSSGEGCITRGGGEYKFEGSWVSLLKTGKACREIEMRGESVYVGRFEADLRGGKGLWWRIEMGRM